MTDQDQRIALCEWAGWKRLKEEDLPTGVNWPVWELNKTRGSIATGTLPNTSSLDVLHEMEKRLDKEQFRQYLYKIHPCSDASQRREALLRTLGLWKD